jgi:hypothetical protein
VVLLGAGFGMCWAFVLRRVVESVAESERERAASSLPTIQLLGYALGAALSGIVANLSGLAADGSRGVVEGAAFWVFAAFLPLAGLGVAAAWRLSRGTEPGSSPSRNARSQMSRNAIGLPSRPMISLPLSSCTAM